jgi:hypothetical protein
VNDRAFDFLDHWEADHFEPVPEGQREQAARQLAIMCREDAVRAGIPISDLEAAASGDLVKSMIEALKEAAN